MSSRIAAEWQGAHFELIDTGGMFGASQDPLHALVLERGHRAIADADLLVFVVDGREGVVPGDREIAQAVRAADKPALLVVNKTDDRRAQAGVVEFHQLGFEPVFEISAEHGDRRWRSARRRSSSGWPAGASLEDGGRAIRQTRSERDR